MILEKLTLTNFRQFRGTQSLEFGHGPKNVTVIFGENGRGKTGIFRAIMFCLYGDLRLSQDGDTPKEELQLINTAELDAHSTSDGAPVTASVELDFSHADTRYTLTRSLRGMIDEGKVLEEKGPVKLAVQPPTGNSNIINDPKVITDTVSSILDHRVREYFLFDGEKMERLTRATAKQKREISKGVRNLLDIDALETAIRGVTKLRSRLDHELAGKATGEYAKVLHSLAEAENDLTHKREGISRLDDEIAHATDEANDIDKKLEGFKEIEGLLLRRTELESREQKITDDLASVRSEIRERTGKTALLITSGTINNVYSYIDGKKEKGQIPTEIRRDLIEKILADQKCICGNHIEPRTNEFQCIQDWLLKSSDQELQDSILNLWKHLSGIQSRYTDIARESENLLQRYAQLKQEQDVVRTEIADLGQSIGSDVRNDAAELETTRKKVKADLIKMEAERQRTAEDVTDLIELIKKLTEQKKGLEREEGLRNELVERSDLAAEVLQALRQVHEQFTQDAKKSIGKDTTDIMKKLLDAESKNLFSEVVVSDDYSLQIRDRWGNPFLANISAGQRQIMSVSFIAALALAASAGKLLEMPLFMDTPFARLSLDHRKNLISNIPELCAQWVLLATDTELRKQEGVLFEDGKKLGAFYMLVPTGDGATQIESRTVADAIALLRESEEGQA